MNNHMAFHKKVMVTLGIGKRPDDLFPVKEKHSNTTPISIILCSDGKDKLSEIFTYHPKNETFNLIIAYPTYFSVIQVPMSAGLYEHYLSLNATTGEVEDFSKWLTTYTPSKHMEYC